MSRTQWPQETVDAVLNLYRSGARGRRIKALTGVPTMTILIMVRNHGLLPAKNPGSSGIRCTNITGVKVCNGLTSDGHKQCDICLSQRMRQRKGRSAKGFCQACGKPAVPGRVRCEVHAKACNDWHAVKKNARKAAGMCVTCGKPDGKYAFRCEKCWFRAAARQTLGGTSMGEAIKAIFLAQNGRCVYTGMVLIPGDNASLDHKIPKALGGSDDIGNLQWVTKDVNTAKWDRTEDQFLELCRKIVSYTSR